MNISFLGMSSERKLNEMGRAKLQIKRIENLTNRQVTYSKRRNGLLKKAYELSVLCEIDVGLLMFSPSGRATIFSGNDRSIEDVLARYVNLPEEELGRKLCNKQYLQNVLSKMKREAMHESNSSVPVETQRQEDQGLLELQQEIKGCKHELEELEKKLSIFEGDPSEITTLTEVLYREQILEETIENVRRQRLALEENYEFRNAGSSSQDNENAIFASGPNLNLDWLPTRDPQIQIMNFLDSNGLLPSRQCHNGADNLQLPATVFQQVPCIQVDNQTSSSSGMEDDENTQQAHLVQPMEFNHSSWPGFYGFGTNQ